MAAPKGHKVDPLNQLRQRKYEAGHGDAEAFNRQHAKQAHCSRAHRAPGRSQLV